MHHFFRDHVSKAEVEDWTIKNKINVVLISVSFFLSRSVKRKSPLPVFLVVSVVQLANVNSREIIGFRCSFVFPR